MYIQQDLSFTAFNVIQVAFLAIDQVWRTLCVTILRNNVSD